MTPKPPPYPGKLLVISGPSGVGKSTIARRIEEQLGGVFSISMTTRPQSPEDQEGVDYYFVSPSRFRQAIDNDDLLEWAQVFDHCYGTPRQPVMDGLDAGKLVILEIDVNGAIQVKQRVPEAVAIFILPPSEASLLTRLRSRQREDEAVIQKRFAKATQEIAKARASGVYDHFVVNDNLAVAVADATDLVRQALARHDDRKTSV